MRTGISGSLKMIGVGLMGAVLCLGAGCGDSTSEVSKPSTSAATASTSGSTALPKPESKVLYESPDFDQQMKSVPPLPAPRKPPVQPQTPENSHTSGPRRPGTNVTPTPPNTHRAGKGDIAEFKKRGEMLIAAHATPTVTVQTNKGTFELQIDPIGVPVTAGNFIDLVQRHFYDGLTFHRYEPGFVIQGGDPAGNGSGGPGYTIPDEYGPLLHEPGALAMAKSSAPNSAGSQFYITLSPAHQLDHNYTVFGKLLKGTGVVANLRAGDQMTKLTVSGLPPGYPGPTK